MMRKIGRMIAFLLAAVLLVQVSWAAELPAEGQEGSADTSYQSLMQLFADPEAPGGFTYPDTYGGAYLDEDGKLVIAVCGAADGLREEISKLQLQDYKVIEVEYSLNELTAWKDAVDQALLQMDADAADFSAEELSLLKDIRTVYVSETDNCICVGLKNITEAKEKAFRAMFGESVPFVFEDGGDVSITEKADFADVARTAWYYDAVASVYRAGLMNGTGGNMFSPDVQMTRGMLITILYRLDGSHPVSREQEIADVPDNLYYTEAVHWALRNQILTLPADGLFRPDDAMTRQEMADMTYRYAQYANLYPKAAGDLSGYADLDAIAEDAVPAFAWCLGTRVILGNDQNRMDPQGLVTRAQYAVLLRRLNYLASSAASGLEDGATIGASLSVTVDGDRLKLLFRNDGETEYGLDSFTVMAAAGEDTWVPLLMEHGYAETGILRTVQPGATREEGLAWKNLYGSLPAGEYRFTERITQGDNAYEVSGTFQLP